jgi:hypothetical protein
MLGQWDKGKGEWAMPVPFFVYPQITQITPIKKQGQ